MNSTGAIEIIDKCLRDKLGPRIPELTPDKRIDDFNLDSLDTVAFIMAIEDEANIKIPDEAAEGWVTIQDVVNTIVELTK